MVVKYEAEISFSVQGSRRVEVILLKDVVSEMVKGAYIIRALQVPIW